MTATPTDWIDFLVRPKSAARSGSALIRINLKVPVRLYDEDRGSGYVVARAVARRRGRQELGLHPCANVLIDPHDWSDSVDAFSAAAAA